MIFFQQFKKGMTSVSSCIVCLVNTVLLFFVYIFGIGLTSFIARLVGKKFLDVRTSKNLSSYWSEKNIGKESFEKYYKQF